MGIRIVGVVCIVCHRTFSADRISQKKCQKCIAQKRKPSRWARKLDVFLSKNL